MSSRKRLPETMNATETAALRETIRTSSTTGLRNRALVEMMLCAGLRVSEACDLRGAAVDLTAGTIRVNQGKGGRDRVVPILPAGMGWIRAWADKRKELGLNGRAPFFVGLRTGPTGKGDREQGEGIKPRFVQALVKRLAEAAGIEKRVTPHILRHTYATGLLDQGFNLREVQTLLGHARLDTTEVYTHVNPEALCAKVRALAEQPEAGANDQAPDLAAVLATLTDDQKKALGAALLREAGDGQAGAHGGS